MAVYPVSIKGQSTLYIKATKAAITAKMKSLGIKNFTIQKNPVPKQMLSKVKLTSLSNVKPPSLSGAGKTVGGPNNPGMKPDLEARSKLDSEIKKKNEAENAKKKKRGLRATRGGSGNQTKTNLKATKINKKTVGNKQKLNQKISELAKKVKSKAPNVSMSKITDTIRGVIRKRPLTSVGVAALAGATVATILKKLGPAAYLTSTKIADTTLTGNKPKIISTKGGQKDKTKKKVKSSVTIIGPLPKPKIDKIIGPLPKPKIGKDTSKKKPDKGGSGKMYNLIAGGKGTAKQRLAEEDAAKVFKKVKGRMPSNKELVTFMNTQKKLFSATEKMFNKRFNKGK